MTLVDTSVGSYSPLGAPTRDDCRALMSFASHFNVHLAKVFIEPGDLGFGKFSPCSKEMDSKRPHGKGVLTQWYHHLVGL